MRNGQSVWEEIHLNYIQKPCTLKHDSTEKYIKLIKKLNKLKILCHLQNIVLYLFKLKFLKLQIAMGLILEYSFMPVTMICPIHSWDNFLYWSPSRKSLSLIKSFISGSMFPLAVSKFQE